MKSFVAYFDILGFKEFMVSHSHEDVEKWINPVFINIEQSLSKGKNVTRNGLAFADIEKSTIHAINFSDTIVFITPNDSIESFKELLDVAHGFNWRMIGYDFPVRGYINYGEIGFRQATPTGYYHVNSIYGKEALKAYQMSELMQWAGTVIDRSVIAKINELSNFDSITADKVIRFNVPFKISPFVIEYREEYCLRLVTDSSNQINEVAFENKEKSIREVFTRHNKDSLSNPSIKLKYDNTIRFLKHLLIHVYK